ncbi:MAG: hypothetical protein CM1200mP2_51270 [Planctomycetaceae bacterium]|nr:MAG: hypothetical protein CM1200mP2_51270 [Planctomycetaceae bacterium]
MAWKGKKRQRNQDRRAALDHDDTIFNGSHIYGICSYGHLRCLDASTGKRIWETIKPTGKDRWWNAFLVNPRRSPVHSQRAG